MNIIDQARGRWRRAMETIEARRPEARKRLRRRWKRSWAGGVAVPWLGRELEVVGKVSGIVTLSLWAKRLVEQFLGSRLVNESILRGRMNELVDEIEERVDERGTRRGRTTRR